MAIPEGIAYFRLRVIQVEGVGKAYGGQTVLRELSWRISGRERIGLVGPNGAGKTTLCRVLAGHEEPDTGQVTRDRTTTVGYLAQEVGATHGGTVLGEALAGFADVWAVEREMEDVVAALAASPDERLTARYGDLQHRFEALGGYRLETEAKAILGGLGFREADFTRPLAELSGGWRMRVELAGLLLVRPDLLLLDEPTNHLDLPSLAWLEGFLAEYDGAVVVVSHDRDFLNRMVTTHRRARARRLRRLSRDVRRLPGRAGSAPRAARGPGPEPGQAGRRDRALHRALPLQGQQGPPGAEPRQDARQDWSGSSSTRWRGEIRLAFPAPPRTGRRVAAPARRPQGVRRPRRVRGHRPRARARRPRRAGRPERRGQVDAAPHPGRRAAVRRGASGSSATGAPRTSTRSTSSTRSTRPAPCWRS